MVPCVETNLPDLFLWTELASFSLHCQHTAGYGVAGTALKSCQQACICLTTGDPGLGTIMAALFFPMCVNRSHYFVLLCIHERRNRPVNALSRRPFFCPPQPSQFIFLPFPITTRRSYAASCARGPASPWRLTNRKPAVGLCACLERNVLQENCQRQAAET